jgi:hypothetical protein
VPRKRDRLDAELDFAGLAGLPARQQNITQCAQQD